MPLTREQIAALKAAAEAARDSVPERLRGEWHGPEHFGMDDEDNALLALCTPETILALLADRAAAEGPGVEAGWEQIAAQYARNADYYRDLLVEIGQMLGPDVYIADDGVAHEDVLIAKVPELVRQRLGAAGETA